MRSRVDFARIPAGETDPIHDARWELDAVQGLSRRFESLIDAPLTEIAQLVGVDYEPLRTLPLAVVTMVDGTFTRVAFGSVAG